MTRQELHHLGGRLRIQVRGPLFEFIDGVLPYLVEAAPVPDREVAAVVGCLVCAARRKAKRETQRRWRRGARRRKVGGG